MPDQGLILSLNPVSDSVLVNGKPVSADNGDFGLVTRIKSNGEHAWTPSISLNGSGHSTTGSIAPTSGSGFWVTTQTLGTTPQILIFDDHSLQIEGNDTLLLKFDPSGSITDLIRGPSAFDSTLQADLSGNLWLTGYHIGNSGYEHSLSFGSLTINTGCTLGEVFGRIGHSGTDSHSVEVGAGVLVSGIDFGNALPLDEKLRAIGIGGTDQDSVRSVITDPLGNAFYAGDFTGRSKFGGNVLKSSGQNDAVFVKFLPGGEIEWARNFGGDGDDLAHSIFADSNGSLFACGTFQGTAEFGDFKLVSAGMRDIFVLRLSANGTPTWAFRAGGPGDDDALALVADDNGSLYLGGSIMQTADFGPYLLSAKGSKDGFLLSLDYGGSVQWVGSLLSTGQAELRDLVLDSMDRPVVAGDFSGLVEFRGTRLANDGSSPIVLKDSEGTSAISDLSSGLVAQYPFDGNASDMSGNGNHGTVYGATLIPDLHGYPDQAYDFDGSDDYINLGNQIPIAESFTILWVNNRAAWGTKKPIIDKWTDFRIVGEDGSGESWLGSQGVDNSSDFMMELPKEKALDSPQPKLNNGRTLLPFMINLDGKPSFS